MLGNVILLTTLYHNVESTKRQFATYLFSSIEESTRIGSELLQVGIHVGLRTSKTLQQCDHYGTITYFLGGEFCNETKWVM